MNCRSSHERWLALFAALIGMQFALHLNQSECLARQSDSSSKSSEIEKANTTEISGESSTVVAESTAAGAKQKSKVADKQKAKPQKATAGEEKTSNDSLAEILKGHSFPRRGIQRRAAPKCLLDGRYRQRPF